MIAETKKLIEDAFEDLELDVLEALGNFLFSFTHYCGLVWNKLCKPSDSGILITSGTEFVLSKSCILTYLSHLSVLSYVVSDCSNHLLPLFPPAGLCTSLTNPE